MEENKNIIDEERRRRSVKVMLSKIIEFRLDKNELISSVDLKKNEICCYGVGYKSLFRVDIKSTDREFMDSYNKSVDFLNELIEKSEFYVDKTDKLNKIVLNVSYDIPGYGYLECTIDFKDTNSYSI